MTARDVLAEIEQRADAATPGPWERRTAPGDDGVSKGQWLADTCRGDDPLQVLVSASSDPQFAYLVPALTGDGPTSVANADFIAHARADVPKLLAALRAVLDEHEPFGSDPGICAGCEHYAPCPTVRAITDALSGVTTRTDR